eukprot:6847672-Pyramimonas_sp.AAC.1
MLTFISPALLKDVLRRAAVRQLECQAADKLQVGWSRVCFDVAKAETRKKKYTPLEAGTIRNLVCGGCWTAERAFSLGYQLSDEQRLCPLCKKAPDTVLHRLWQYEAVAEEREPLVTASALDRASGVLSDSEMMLFTR